jgi:xylulokinase
MLHNFSTGGMVIRWYRDEFCTAEKQIEELTGINAYQLLDREVQQVPPGCEGLVVLPHLQGSGPPDLDAYARGVIFGLTLAHKKQHLTRAIMEGVAMVLRRMIDSTTPLGVEVTEIISLSGGAKSDAWCQVKADATQVPVRTLHGTGSAACRGAAIIAGVAIGMWESAATAARSAIEPDKLFTPRAEYASVYDELFQRYDDLQQALQPMFSPASTAPDTGI